MRKSTVTLLAFLAVALMLPLLGCHKTPKTTPRYNKDNCLACAPFGHEEAAGKCGYCKSSAVCQFCQGKGKRQVGTAGHFYEETCAFCAGSGKCHYCSGTGKCGICGGTGKYVPLRPAADSSGPRDSAAQVK